MSPRNGAKTRERITAAATELFSQRGYNGATMREIARLCDLTEAAIYKHFAGKEKLYEEVILGKSREHAIGAYLEKQRGDGTIEDVLFTVARHILNTAREDKQLIRILLYSSLEGFHASTILYRELRHPYIHFLREELKERIVSGEVRAVNPFVTSRCFVGMVMDCALNVEFWNKLEGSTFTSETVMNNNVPIFARGLGAE
jgi:AcrR family transcriptional regulator